MIRIGLLGFSGRMGGLVAHTISSQEEIILSSLYVRDKNISFECEYVGNQWKEFLKHCEVVIDFSNYQATSQLLQAAKDNPKPMVIGTTGLDYQTLQEIEKLSKIMPIVYATNTSRGIVLLNRIASLVARSLKDADIEIVETHHHHKKDAPSGTAMTLAECCALARGVDLKKVRVSGRDGNIGERKRDEIAVMSLRGGDIVGRHTIGFYCNGEYLELTHQATSRETFALGAIEAAKWVFCQKNGLYHMEDVLKQ